MAVVAVLSMAGLVRAQENVLPLQYGKTSFAEAMSKAKREYRVLLVIRNWKRPPEFHRPWWANDAARAWLMWHAVVVEVPAGSPEAREYDSMNPPDNGTNFFGVDMFVNGRRVNYARFGPARYAPNAKGPDDWEPGGQVVLPTATALLELIDDQMEALAQEQAIWMSEHERLCPPPARPDRAYWFDKAADDLPASTDLKDPKPGERYVDVAARLKEADRLTAAGKKLEAFAALTWLWERGPEVDPGFALTRVGLVLPRMTALADKDERIAKRMLAIAESELSLYPWYDDSDEMAYLALRYHERRRSELIKRVIVENVDPDEQTMAGIVGRRLGDMKAVITELSKDKVIGPSDWARLCREARKTMPSSVDPEPRERWRRQTVELLTVATIRTYTTLLASGDVADRARAEEMAFTLINISEKADPPVRAAVLRALVFAAVSVGKADAVHASWVSDAQQLLLAPPPVKKGKSGAQDAEQAKHPVPNPLLADPLMRHCVAKTPDAVR